MILATLFGKRLKIWSVIRGNAVFLLFLVCSAELVVLCNASFSHQVCQPKCNSRFYLERNRMAALTFRKKKQQQSRVFFDVIFAVYTHVDNRERARASD